MVATAPHYLLLTESRSFDDNTEACGLWRFSLRRLDGSESLDVSDTEPGVLGERLQLLAVIRGLEAIGQPSRVTLVTSSPYVTRGIRRGLDAWREMHWTWERFGELHPIKHVDLWRRLDHALQFHSVRCRAWRVAGELSSDTPLTAPVAPLPEPETRTAAHRTGSGAIRHRRRFGDGWVQLARQMGRRTGRTSWATAH